MCIAILVLIAFLFAFGVLKVSCSSSSDSPEFHPDAIPATKPKESLKEAMIRERSLHRQSMEESKIAFLSKELTIHGRYMDCTRDEYLAMSREKQQLYMKAALLRKNNLVMTPNRRL